MVYIAGSWCPEARSPLTRRRFEAAPATLVDMFVEPVADRHSPESTISVPAIKVAALVTAYCGEPARTERHRT